LTFENEQLKAQMSEMMKQMQAFMAKKPEAKKEEVEIPEGMVKCDVCGETVKDNRLKAHLNYKHNIKDTG
jgi:hypothetical protein